jgi:histidinol-phosphate phosphatase family protein
MTTAAMLAGGQGKRLRSVMSDRPKVLAPVAGRRFLAYLLDQLADAAFEDVVLCTGYLGEQVQNAFGDHWRGLRLHYSQEPSPLGTAGALRFALEAIRSEDVVVLNGDSFCDINLKTLVEFHCAQHAAATIALTHVSDVSRYGAVRLNEAGMVEGFAEKGSKGPGLISAGVYVLGRAFLASIPPNAPISLEGDCFPKWIGKGVSGFRGGNRFLDIGTPESLAQAQAFFAPPSDVVTADGSRPYVLLDRDGTINVERNYLSHPDQLELLPGAIEGMRKLRTIGAGLAVISNQAGIGRKYFDLAQLQRIHDCLRAMLGDEDVAVDGIYFCPHTPADRCGCRKPEAGMVRQAERELGFNARQSYVVGDKLCDIELGRRLGAITLLVRTGYGRQSIAEGVSADYIVDDLRHAADVVADLAHHTVREQIANH